jgi:DNA replication and repair protein RecF
MQLTHLSLTNFRNFVRLEWDFCPGVTLLVGGNAQGKTSLLEAIFFLTGGTSPLAQNDGQLINFLAQRQPQAFARIVAEVRRDDRPQRIEIRILLEETPTNHVPRARKEVLINGLKKRQRHLAGVFNAVLFRPQDLLILEGSPSERRRYFDDAFSQADALYTDALAEYGKVLTQRNALLKRLQEGEADVDELAFWDEQFAQHAAQIMRRRILGLRELEALAAPIQSDLTRGEEALRLAYLPTYDPFSQAAQQLDLPLAAQPDWSALSLEKLRQGLQSALLRLRREEIGRGMTLIGPHRDDFSFLSNGIDLRPYGSRGQIRTAMLATKLAEVKWLRERTGTWPILLLDEVLAELDIERRDDLLAVVSDAQQALLTTTDLGMFGEQFYRQATLCQVNAGTLSSLDA